MNQQKQRLDTCGCCEGVKALTSVPVHNQPGLSALAYRVGTHASFKATMRSALSKQSALRDLTTRDDDDPSIALLDAWATVLDVLSFYQERIANEGYLRTATERRSILEMARSIGYELRPGVAAGTYLAFTLEDAPGSPLEVTIGVGTKTQSVPGQDELPQTFETVEEVKAKVEWNALKPRVTMPHEISGGTTKLYLKGTDTQLRPGDAILLVGAHRKRWPGSECWDFRIIHTVTPCSDKDYTLITWQEGLGHKQPSVEPADNPKVFAFRQRAALFGYNAPDWRAMSEEIKKAYAGPGWKKKKQWPGFEIGEENRIFLDSAYPKILEGSWVVLEKPSYVELYRAVSIVTDSRTDFTLTSKTTSIELDTQEHLSWFGLRDTVVYAQSEQLELAEQPLTISVFGNRVVLDRLVKGLEQGQNLIVNGKRLRHVTVAERTRVVRVGKEEITEPEAQSFLVSGDGLQRVALEEGEVLEVLNPPSLVPDGRVTWHLRNEKGFSGFVTAEPDCFTPEQETRQATVAGQSGLAKEHDALISEVVELERTEADGEVTTLVLATTLQNVYLCDTVTINANVARATHGETKTEVVGSGDGSQGMQVLTLKQAPLTYVSVPTPSGTDSTLEIRVNDVLWEEVPSLYQLPAEKRAYITRLADDGKVTIQFGDGINGARLPTGVENVKAAYRVGTGMDGMVDSGQISLLMTRPLGVKSAVNPLAPTGAADPEQRDQARRNAPLTVLTLDRIVSLQDFEDFARALAGIDKAQATLLWNGERRMVHLTVAAAGGKSVDKTSDLYKNLIAGIDAARHPDQQVLVDSYHSLRFNVVAKVRVDSYFIMEDVLEAVSKELQEAFAFDTRDFGQAVTASKLLAVMQRVNGVIAVDLDKLHFSSQAAALHMRLPAHIAHWDQSRISIKAAELLLVNPEGIALTEMTVWH